MTAENKTISLWAQLKPLSRDKQGFIYNAIEYCIKHKKIAWDPRSKYDDFKISTYFLYYDDEDCLKHVDVFIKDDRLVWLSCIPDVDTIIKINNLDTVIATSLYTVSDLMGDEPTQEHLEHVLVSLNQNNLLNLHQRITSNSGKSILLLDTILVGFGNASPNVLFKHKFFGQVPDVWDCIMHTLSQSCYLFVCKQEEIKQLIDGFVEKCQEHDFLYRGDSGYEWKFIDYGHFNRDLEPVKKLFNFIASEWSNRAPSKALHDKRMKEIQDRRLLLEQYLPTDLARSVTKYFNTCNL